MKLEVKSQITIHELKTALIGSLHQKSQKIVGSIPLYLVLSFFLGHRTRGFVLEKQIVIHMTQKCDTHVTAFLGIISSELHCLPKNWYNVVGRFLLKANNILPFW